MRKRTGRRAVVTGLAAVALLAGLTAYGAWLWHGVTLPTGADRQPLVIYGAPLVLEAGLHPATARVAPRLLRLGYRPVTREVREPGEYRLAPDRLDLYLQADAEAGGDPAAVRLVIEEGRVVRLVRLPEERESPPVTLRAPVIGGLLEGARQVRQWIPLAAMPRHLVEAVLAVEDRRFYRHPGLDPIAVMRALRTNLTQGRVVEGGSTITQQLAKNLYYTRRRTVARKLQEAAAALVLESKYSKDAILETYLNEVYFGQLGSVAVHGIGEAARHYFKKPVEALTLPEAALLAGMIKAPQTYGPAKAEAARERRALVLRRLREEGKLSPQAFQAAVAQPLPAAPEPGTAADAPYFVDYLLRGLSSASEELLAHGGKVMSTLDQELQRVAETALTSGLAGLEASRPALQRADQPLQGAVVALDVKTGGVRAMVGGRDYRASQFNRAVQARRQAGSLIKPFVYVAAFESSLLSPAGAITPASLIEDAPISFPAAAGASGSWTPQNYDRRFRGEVTIRTALEQSLNVPAVRLAQTIGMSRVADLLQGLGLPPAPAGDLSVVLGTSDVSLLDITAAYGALATGGWRLAPGGIRRLVLPDSQAVTPTAEEPRRVLSPQVAYLATSLLQGVVDRGTAVRAASLGLHKKIAGKTGTTDEHRDAWFIGYTSDLIVGVWVGFDDGRELGLTGAEAALPIWMAVVRQVVPPDQPDFPKPDGIVERRIDPQTGQLARSSCPEVLEEAFIDGTEPTAYCLLHGAGLIERLREALGLS